MEVPPRLHQGKGFTWLPCCCKWLAVASCQSMLTHTHYQLATCALKNSTLWRGWDRNPTHRLDVFSASVFLGTSVWLVDGSISLWPTWVIVWPLCTCRCHVTRWVRTLTSGSCAWTAGASWRSKPSPLTGGRIAGFPTPNTATSELRYRPPGGRRCLCSLTTWR